MIVILKKLKKLKRYIKIGLAFSFQKITSVPINQFDKKLDFIITEKEILLMRILFLGDVVGISGCSKLMNNLKNEIQSKKIDFVIVNGENAAAHKVLV